MKHLQIGTADFSQCAEAVARHAGQDSGRRTWSSPAAWQEKEGESFVWYYGVIPHMNQGGPKIALVWLDETDLF